MRVKENMMCYQGQDFVLLYYDDEYGHFHFIVRISGYQLFLLTQLLMQRNELRIYVSIFALL